MLSHLILYAWLAGFSVFVGGLIACLFHEYVKNGIIKQYVIHSALALGSGILLSAVALVLIPKGMENLSLLPIVSTFILGILVFAWLDSYLAKKSGQLGALLAMLMDFLPEVIALGALFAVEPEVALLLAIFIGVQNIPEAFSAYIELEKHKIKRHTILIIFFLLSFVGVIAAVLGLWLLAEQPKLTAGLMVFAAGGILYILFNDLAPEVKMKKSTIPAMLAAVGFGLGMIGEKLVG